jgi:hypothetical protein
VAYIEKARQGILHAILSGIADFGVTARSHKVYIIIGWFRHLHLHAGASVRPAKTMRGYSTTEHLGAKSA